MHVICAEERLPTVHVISAQAGIIGNVSQFSSHGPTFQQFSSHDPTFHMFQAYAWGAAHDIRGAWRRLELLWDLHQETEARKITMLAFEVICDRGIMSWNRVHQGGPWTEDFGFESAVQLDPHGFESALQLDPQDYKDDIAFR
eukprot:g7297.t1